MKPETVRAMVVFVEVAKQKSFSRAAEAMALPKSTISRRVAQLEREVGLKLFVRTTQRVELTEEGLVYFQRCRRILEDADVAHEDLGDNREVVRGQLNVAATADFGLRLVPELPTFCRRFPDLVLNFDFTSRRIDPLSENYDVTIYIGDPPDSNLTARRLGESSRHFYASRDYLASHGKPTAPPDLVAHNCLREARFDGKGIERVWRCIRGFECMDVEIHGNVFMNSIGIIRRLAVAGHGIASLPVDLCTDELATGKLIRALDEWTAPPVPFYGLTATRLVPAKTRAFLDFVEEQLR